MQEHSFYPDSAELITPDLTLSQRDKELAATAPLQTVILFYSRQLLQLLLEQERIEVIHPDLTIGSAAMKAPICRIPGTLIGAVLSGIGAPAAAGTVEELRTLFPLERIIAFGSCGVLTELPEGRIIVPVQGYRDEGTSFHYASPSRWIRFRSADRLNACFSALHTETVLGNLWTTDAFYRETREEAELRVSQGCIAVDMEATALQSVCDFRGLELFQFLYSADSLHGDWQRRILGAMEKDSRIAMFQLAEKVALELIKTAASE